MKQNDTKGDKKYYTKFDERLNNFFVQIFNKIGIAGSIIAIILFLILFIWLTSQQPFWFSFDIASSSNVGDALGGITNPIIGFIAVILTYRAFRVQYDFNEKQLGFIKNDKVDRKVDEYNKMLDSIIANDIYKDMDIRFILRYSTQFLVDKRKNDKYIPGVSFASVLYSSYVDYYVFHKNPFVEIENPNFFDNAELTPEQQEYQIQIEVILDVYIKFFSLLLSFVQELNHIESRSEDKEKSINSFFNKFEILYHNFDENFLLIVFHYFYRMEANNDYTDMNREIIIKVLNNSSSNNENVADVLNLVDYIINKNEMDIEYFNKNKNK